MLSGTAPKIIEIKSENIKTVNGEVELVFSVQDNGIGIDPKFHESIFKIFKRLHREGKYGGGTGSGLTFVKKIIDRYNGRIWLESTLGQGTCFYFTLPEQGKGKAQYE